MREKSSSVLTSLLSRNPLRQTISRSSRVSIVQPAGPAAQLGDGVEDQRQRGAELVADVGEERGLGAVEFGELFGPPLLGSDSCGRCRFPQRYVPRPA